MTCVGWWEPALLGERIAQQGVGTGTGMAARFRGVGHERLGRFDGGRYAVSKVDSTGGIDSGRFALLPVSWDVTPPEGGRCCRPDPQGIILIYHVPFVVRCTAAALIAHPFGVVRGTAINRSVIGDWGESVCRLAIVDNLLHGGARVFVDALEVLLEFGVHDHNVEGVGRRFWPFCFGGQFCGRGSSDGDGSVARGRYHSGSS